MLNVVVSKPVFREMRGISKATQKPYHLAFQDVHVYCVGPDGKPNEFPDKVELMLELNASGVFEPHPAGRYVLHPSSVQVGRDGLQIRPILVPVGSKPAV